MLALLMPGTIKLLGNTEMNINKDKDGEYVPNLETIEVELADCNVVSINCQQNSKVLYTFILNKLFGQLLKT